MTDVDKQVLENQEIILLALSQLLLSQTGCTDPKHRQTNNLLIDNYHKTRMLLGKDYIKRW